MLDIEYKIILAKKKKLYEFEIAFLEDNFYHLVGLQYLTDLSFLKTSRTKVFHKILNEEITQEDIEKSVFYKNIEDRLDGFFSIEKILDSNDTVFRFCQEKAWFSKIPAKYLLQTNWEDNTNYIFLDELDSNTMFCRSFFFNNENNYSQNQTRMFLLYKEKYIKTTNDKIVLFDKLSRNEPALV